MLHNSLIGGTALYVAQLGKDETENEPLFFGLTAALAGPKKDCS